MFSIADSSYTPLMSKGPKNPSYDHLHEIKDALINRWTLHSMLGEGLDIKYGKKFTRYEEKGDKVTAYFEDGTEETAGKLNFFANARIIDNLMTE